MDYITTMRHQMLKIADFDEFRLDARKIDKN